MKHTRAASFVLLNLALWQSAAWAGQSVTIVDCGGKELASSPVQDSRPKMVAFKLLDQHRNPAADSDLVLTSSATAKSLAGRSADGSVAFEGISPGTWKACVTPQTTVIDKVTIGEQKVNETMAIWGAAAGAGVATGVALGIAHSDGGEGGTVVVESSFPAEQTRQPAVPTAPAAAQSEEHKPLIPAHPCQKGVGRADSQDDCFTHETPAPLSPFF
jgi:hypothetical protein